MSATSSCINVFDAVPGIAGKQRLASDSEYHGCRQILAQMFVNNNIRVQKTEVRLRDARCVDSTSLYVKWFLNQPDILCGRGWNTAEAVGLVVRTGCPCGYVPNLATSCSLRSILSIVGPWREVTTKRDVLRQDMLMVARARDSVRSRKQSQPLALTALRTRLKHCPIQHTDNFGLLLRRSGFIRYVQIGLSADCLSSRRCRRHAPLSCYTQQPTI